MSPVQPSTSAVPSRSSSRFVRSAVVFGGVMFLVAVSWTGYRLWNGEPYPEVDPNVVAMRLNEEAQRVEEDLALPGRTDSGSSSHRVDTGACYYHGLRSVAHIDEARQDVRSFALDWSTTGVPRTTARAGFRNASAAGHSRAGSSPARTSPTWVSASSARELATRSMWTGTSPLGRSPSQSTRPAGRSPAVSTSKPSTRRGRHWSPERY